MAKKKKPQLTPEKEIEIFNKQHRVRTLVDVKQADGLFRARTRSQAFLTGGINPSVLVTGITGPVALNKIKPL